MDPDWFGTLIRKLIEAGPKAMATGQVRPGEPEVEGGFVPAIYSEETPAVYEGRVSGDVLCSGNMALHRSVVDTVGSFDERLGAGSRFPAAEDNDLGFRLLDAGYRIVYVPEAIVYHRAWRPKREYLPMRWKYGYGQGAFFAKHFSLRDRFMIRRMLQSLGRYASRCMRYALRRSRLQTMGDVVYILGMLSGSGKWLLTQKRSR